MIRRDGRAVEGTGLENRRCESIRGFESHSLRQLNFSIDLRKYPRGRRGSPAKGVGRVKSVAEVQILSSAPRKDLETIRFQGLFAFLTGFEMLCIEKPYAVDCNIALFFRESPPVIGIGRKSDGSLRQWSVLSGARYSRSLDGIVSPGAVDSKGRMCYNHITYHHTMFVGKNENFAFAQLAGMRCRGLNRGRMAV